MHTHPTTVRFDLPVRHVEPHGARRWYRRGDTLVHAGDVLQIEQCLVPAFDGRDQILAVLGAEAALGYEALVADVVALSAVAAVAWDRAAFLTDLRGDPDRALAVARGVGLRLRAACDDQARAYRPVLDRLAAAMVDLAQRCGEPAHDGRRVLSCGLDHQALNDRVRVGPHAPRSHGLRVPHDDVDAVGGRRVAAVVLGQPGLERAFGRFLVGAGRSVRRLAALGRPAPVRGVRDGVARAFQRDVGEVVRQVDKPRAAQTASALAASRLRNQTPGLPSAST